MSELIITVIDVGWGDSLLLETRNDQGSSQFGLIDSNDSENLRSSFIFIKRYLEKRFGGTSIPNPLFEFVLLTHEHADHAKGLKRIMQAYGTKRFLYPKSAEWSSYIDLIRYAKHSSKVQHHQSIDDSKIFPKLGEVDIQVLWPQYGARPDHNPNNNSVVLQLQLGQHSVILSGDAEKEVWHQIEHKINNNISFFKVPHHGSEHGTFDAQRKTPWLNKCSPNTELIISAHLVPFKHPDQSVIDEFTNKKFQFYRTDEHFYVQFWTNGQQKQVRYFH